MAEWARLLLTRPLPSARRFLGLCEAAWGGPIPAVLSPVMRISPVPVALAEQPAALILTSEHGAERAGALGLTGLPAWCVGPRTAATARAQGLRAFEAGPDSKGLLAVLLADPPQAPLLHLRGEHAYGDIAGQLRAAGLTASEAVAYRQEALPPTPEARAALDGPEPLVVPLFSSRSARLLTGWRPRTPLRVVAMSEAVREAAAPLRPERLVLAAVPTGAAMVEGTIRLLALPEREGS